MQLVLLVSEVSNLWGIYCIVDVVFGEERARNSMNTLPSSKLREIFVLWRLTCNIGSNGWAYQYQNLCTLVSIVDTLPFNSVNKKHKPSACHVEEVSCECNHGNIEKDWQGRQHD